MDRQLSAPRTGASYSFS